MPGLTRQHPLSSALNIESREGRDKPNHGNLQGPPEPSSAGPCGAAPHREEA